MRKFIVILFLIMSSTGLVNAQSTHCYTDLIGNTDCTYSTPIPTYVYIPTYTTTVVPTTHSTILIKEIPQNDAENIQPFLGILALSLFVAATYLIKKGLKK